MNKAALREIFQAKRQAISQEEVEGMSRKICKIFFQEVSLEQVKHLHIFLPIARHKEVNTWLIIRRLQKDYPHIGVVVSRTDWKKKEMLHYHLRPETLLEESSLGIPEPVNGAVCPAEKIDLVLMPLLTFDHKGQRVGYGAGFYDRFLASCLPLTQKMGLSLFGPSPEPISDVQPHDIPLDACITPKKVYYFE